MNGRGAKDKNNRELQLSKHENAFFASSYCSPVAAKFNFDQNPEFDSCYEEKLKTMGTRSAVDACYEELK
jgi:hypothetical protein